MQANDRWDVEIADKAEFGALMSVLSGNTYTKMPNSEYVAKHGEDPHALERLRDAISGSNLPREFPTNVSVSRRALENMELWAMWKAQQCVKAGNLRGAAMYEERAKTFHQACYVKI